MPTVYNKVFNVWCYSCRTHSLLIEENTSILILKKGNLADSYGLVGWMQVLQVL